MWGTFLFLFIFLLVLVYAFSPRNQETFDHARSLPLEDQQ